MAKSRPGKKLFIGQIPRLTEEDLIEEFRGYTYSRYICVTKVSFETLLGTFSMYLQAK